MYGLSDIDFSAIETAQSPTLHKDAAEAIQLAKYATVGITVLQAIAAFSALTLAAIAYANYSKEHRRSSKRRK